MEVSGKYNLTSDTARRLFLISTVWITAHWEKEGRLVSKIQIKPKTIGRNPGFIMCTTITCPNEMVNYYAKIQRIEIDTVMVHYLLKYTRCGPEDFLVTVLSPNTEDRYLSRPKLHGVVTREVLGFKMASLFSPVDRAMFTGHSLATQCFSFMLTFLIKFGCFGNIPGNKANWGFAPSAVKETASLKLVDFSSSHDGHGSMKQREFRGTWDSVNTSVLRCMFSGDEVPEKCYHLSKYRHFGKRFPWLQSRESFVQLMQRVINSTDEWITDRTHATTINPKPYKDAGFSMIVHTSDSDADSSDCGSVQSADLDISMLTHDDPLVVSGIVRSECNAATKALYVSYNTWVSRWNKQMREFVCWFPFPVVPALVERVSSVSSVVKIVKVKSSTRKRKQMRGSKKRVKKAGT